MADEYHMVRNLPLFVSFIAYKMKSERQLPSGHLSSGHNKNWTLVQWQLKFHIIMSS